MSPPASVVVDAAVRRRRIDRYLADLGHWGSRAQVQRILTAGGVRLDGVPAVANTIVHPGQTITVEAAALPAAPSTVEAEDIPLAILYEDASILVVNKPAGMVVHPAAGNWRGTLVAALMHHWRGAPGDLDPQRLGLVHRLDKDTSGVLLVAKDAVALEHLAAQFRRRSVDKEYLAVVWGRPREAKGVIDAPVGRHPVQRKRMTVRADGRAAVTRFEVLRSGPQVSLLRLEPRTGRTHQIRVHLRALGHPIVGDTVYGRKRTAPAPARIGRQALHAARLSFDHPRTGERVTFAAPLPADMEALLAFLT